MIKKLLMCLALAALLASCASTKTAWEPKPVFVAKCTAACDMTYFGPQQAPPLTGWDLFTHEIFGFLRQAASETPMTAGIFVGGSVLEKAVGNAGGNSYISGSYNSAQDRHDTTVSDSGNTPTTVTGSNLGSYNGDNRDNADNHAVDSHNTDSHDADSHAVDNHAVSGVTP